MEEKDQVLEAQLEVAEAQAPEEPSPALEGIQDLAQQAQPKQTKATEEEKEYVRRLREAKAESDREREALLRRLEAIEQRQSAPKEQEEDFNFNINPEDIAEGKHLLKINRRLQKIESDYQERLNAIQQQAQALAAETQLRAQYPDIDKVINPEAIAVLRQEYPELAASINSNGDLYTKSVAAYTVIKKLGIHKDESILEGQARLQQNNAKPRMSASVAPQRADSPLSQANAYANGLTKDMKKQAAAELAEILGR